MMMNPSPPPKPINSKKAALLNDHEKRINAELAQIVLDIRRIGEPGSSECLFGELFDDEEAEQYYEALVGTLKSAKKRGIVSFQGQMLLKGIHDNVGISIVQGEHKQQQQQSTGELLLHQNTPPRRHQPRATKSCSSYTPVRPPSSPSTPTLCRVKESPPSFKRTPPPSWKIPGSNTPLRDASKSRPSWAKFSSLTSIPPKAQIKVLSVEDNASDTETEQSARRNTLTKASLLVTMTCNLSDSETEVVEKKTSPRHKPKIMRSSSVRGSITDRWTQRPTTSWKSSKHLQGKLDTGSSTKDTNTIPVIPETLVVTSPTPKKSNTPSPKKLSLYRKFKARSPLLSSQSCHTFSDKENLKVLPITGKVASPLFRRRRKGEKVIPTVTEGGDAVVSMVGDTTLDAGDESTPKQAPPPPPPPPTPKQAPPPPFAPTRAGNSGEYAQKATPARSEIYSLNRSKSKQVVDSIAAGIDDEVSGLVKDICRVGSNPGEPQVSFGELFDDDIVQNTYEALLGTLRSAKRQGLITFDGQVLLKGVHDRVMIEVVEK